MKLRQMTLLPLLVLLTLVLSGTVQAGNSAEPSLGG